jgi:endonuclease YncB( thermonuclease family)
MTCLVDGDTGWELGVKWRLEHVDTPELTSPECQLEYQRALSARDRLRQLISAGYRIEWSGSSDRYGRALVRITLHDGRDAGDALLGEGLAQTWPNRANVWCHGTGTPSTWERWGGSFRNALRSGYRFLTARVLGLLAFG